MTATTKGALRFVTTDAHPNQGSLTICAATAGGSMRYVELSRMDLLLVLAVGASTLRLHERQKADRGAA